RTDTFLGERFRRIARRRGSKKAIVAVGRSILVIIWHLLSDPTARYADLGPGFYDARISHSRKTRNHVRQLEALGYKVSLEPAALPVSAGDRKRFDWGSWGCGRPGFGCACSLPPDSCRFCERADGSGTGRAPGRRSRRRRR